MSAQAEATLATQVFRAALAYYGAQAAADALVAWQDYPTNATAAQRARWVKRSVDEVMERRPQVRALALAYYRLIRALLLGRTVPLPGEDDKDTSLDALRREFRLQAGEPGEEFRPSGGGAKRIPIDRDTDAFGEDDEESAAQEAETVLDALGPGRLDKVAQAVEKEMNRRDREEPLTAREAAEELDAARDKAGAAQAAAVSRMVENAGRGAVFDAIQADGKALGWVRVSDGDPCAFCAMLLSRGAVYKSAESAYGDGDLYHDNCQCVAVPVFTRAQYREGAEFELNREMTALYKELKSRGFDGDSALNAIRRALKDRKRAAGSRGHTETTQEASAK